jgi:MFS family permease
MVPASLSLVLASVPAAIRSQAIGTWSAVAAMGAALGPVIGGSLVQLSWRWVFWINLPVGLAAVLLAARVVPESRDERETGRPESCSASTLPGCATRTACSPARPEACAGTGACAATRGWR